MQKGQALADAIGKIVPGGTVVCLGNSSGTPTPISLFDFMGHEGARLVSFMNYVFEERAQTDLTTLLGCLARGEVTPQIGRMENWHDLEDVLEDLRARRFAGKAVLCVAPK